ncbi:MAG: type III toxin-antitoxin system ToxN/AbiQ family toxin [Fusobacterium sp.]
MKFYLVNEKYLDFLRTSESKIMNGSSKYRGDKFVLGIVLKINSINYYAPISSIKPYQLKNELTLTKECRKTCL